MKTSNPDSLTWARNTLKINSELEQEKSILKFLENEHFILSDQETEAIDILTGTEAKSSGNHFKNYCTDSLLQDLSTFRKNFFDIAISERRKKLALFKEQSKDSIACQAIVYELRKGLFLDKEQFPENNEALKILIDLFTSSPSKRAGIFDKLVGKTLDEKKVLQQQYEALALIDEDFHSLYPQIENIIYPKQKVDLDVSTKKSRKKNYFLACILIYFLIRMFMIYGPSSVPDGASIPDNKKPETPKTEKKKDKFLEYMEKEGDLKKQETPDE